MFNHFFKELLYSVDSSVVSETFSHFLSIAIVNTELFKI